MNGRAASERAEGQADIHCRRRAAPVEPEWKLRAVQKSRFLRLGGIANGPEFVALALREWIAAVGAKTAYIEPGSPWENGYCESFNSKLRDELLNGEVFFSLAEAQVLIEAWRRHYNVTGVLPPPFRAAAWRRYSERLEAPIRVDHRA